MGSEKKSLRERVPQIPEALEEKAKGILGRYLIYYNLDKRTREAVCSSCGRTIVAEKGDTGEFGKLWAAVHHTKGKCPACGEEVVYIAAGKMRNFASLQKDDRFLFVWAETHDRIWMMAAHGWLKISQQDYTTEFRYCPDSIWMLESGKVECEKVRNSDWFGWQRWEYDHSWSVPANPYHQPYNPYMGYGGGCWNVLDEDEDGALFQNTFLKFAENAYRSRQKGISRTELVFMAERPKLAEMLVKLGAEWVIGDEITRECKNKRLLDWNAQTPHGFFRLDKASFKVWHSHGCSKTALELYHAGKKVKITPKAKENIA